MILLTGATGKFGSTTAQYLQQKNISFRAASKNLEALRKRFDNKTEIITFDWEKPETFGDPLKGISVVHIMPPPVVTSDFHKTAKPFLEAAKIAGVKHIVFTTALYSDHPDSMFYGSEELTNQSGLDFTIIRPSFVFQNFLNQFLPAVQNGFIVAPSENGKTSYVDVRNVGEATATVLANPDAHKGKTYSITGAEALSHKQMAEIFSQQLSKPVVHISPTPDEFKKNLAEAGVPVFLHDFLAALYNTIAKGQWEKVSQDYTTLTGKKPKRFVDFVQEYQSTFLGAKS